MSHKIPIVDTWRRPYRPASRFADIRRPYSTREVSLPELDDGHSGNAFGGACALAFALLTGQRV
jgi:hypothetical protein